MPNISTDRGDRCSGQNGSYLFSISHSDWFQDSLHELYDVVIRWYRQGVNRRPLRIGIRCKWGKHRSLAFMLLFARCCRHYNHVVYHYALDAPICGCPELVSFRNFEWMTEQQRGQYQMYWDARAYAAEQRALALFQHFPLTPM